MDDYVKYIVAPVLKTEILPPKIAHTTGMMMIIIIIIIKIVAKWVHYTSMIFMLHPTCTEAKMRLPLLLKFYIINDVFIKETLLLRIVLKLIYQCQNPKRTTNPI